MANNNPSNGRSHPEDRRNREIPTSPHSSGPNHLKNGSGKATLAAILTITLFACLLVIGLLPRLRQSHKISAIAISEGSDAPRVIVTQPQQSIDTILSLPGSTQAIEDAQIGARTTGYVTKRFVDIGSHVHAGQVLAEIDSPDVDQQLVQAAAQVAQSRATVEQSRADLSGKRATESQYRSNVGQAQANVEQMKAQLADAQARLIQLQSAEKSAESPARSSIAGSFRAQGRRSSG